MDWRTYITADFKIMMGKPIIIGTRLPVELILEKIAAGETFEQILEAHPRLTPEAIRAAIAFAADDRLNAAALAEGLLIDNPNLHL